MSHPLQPQEAFRGTAGAAVWSGYAVDDADAFRAYLSEDVGPRVRDQESAPSLADTMRALATTHMETQFLEQLLSSEPPIEPWEVGEALAECLLRQGQPEDVVLLPWNAVRDRRTPRASLPGADLVGFRITEDGPILLFGEVKTSGDENAPPGVMYGGSGMAWQLKDEATRLDIQHTLLKWLFHRCLDGSFQDLYEFSLRQYIKSEGTAIRLYGVLLRDTAPTERDIKGRAQHVGATCRDHMTVRISAWYLPLSIDDWPAAIARAA